MAFFASQFPARYGLAVQLVGDADQPGDLGAVQLPLVIEFALWGGEGDGAILNRKLLGGGQVFDLPVIAEVGDRLLFG